MSLLYTGQQLTIYLGLFLLITGIIGNSINILIFTSHRIYRRTPTTFYFLAATITNLIYLLVNLTSRILTVGYGIDLTSFTVFWCKTKNFLIVTAGLISFSYSCLAAIDQFLLTSRNVNYRLYSDIKWAYKVVISVIIFWCLHGITCLVFFDIPPDSNICIITNTGFGVYSQVFLFVHISTVPILIMLVFGCLTYRNIRQTIVLAQQQADRQVTKMTFIQIALVVISHTPFAINYTYGFITAKAVKDTNQILIENFISTIVGIVSYLYYAGSCYMFLISSSRFRRAVKDQLFRWYRRNRIIPFHQPRC